GSMQQSEHHSGKRCNNASGRSRDPRTDGEDDRPFRGREHQLPPRQSLQRHSDVEQKHGERERGRYRTQSGASCEGPEEAALIAGFAKPQPVGIELDGHGPDQHQQGKACDHQPAPTLRHRFPFRNLGGDAWLAALSLPLKLISDPVEHLLFFVGNFSKSQNTSRCGSYGRTRGEQTTLDGFALSGGAGFRHSPEHVKGPVAEKIWWRMSQPFRQLEIRWRPGHDATRTRGPYNHFTFWAGNVS